MEVFSANTSSLFVSFHWKQFEGKNEKHASTVLISLIPSH